jgi:hypothetical protein
MSRLPWNFGDGPVAFRPDTIAKDYFGTCVAISGDVLVAGSYGHGSGAGAAYVFTKASRGWEPTAELKGPGTTAGDHFGAYVAISGDLIAVSALGHGASPSRVYVFQKSVVGWHQVAELEGSGPAERGFGEETAVSGSTIVVGGDESVYVFAKAAAGWDRTATLLTHRSFDWAVGPVSKV